MLFGRFVPILAVLASPARLRRAAEHRRPRHAPPRHADLRRLPRRVRDHIRVAQLPRGTVPRPARRVPQPAALLGPIFTKSMCHGPDLDAIFTARLRHSGCHARIDSSARRMNTQRRQDDPRLNATAAATRRRRESCHADRACPPHAWDCPVLMKLDPRSVAWTCAKCGAIVTVPVGAPRPR
jgi:hypothetical protein